VTKKTLLPLITILLFAVFVTLAILRYRSQKTTFLDSVPIIPTSSPRSLPQSDIEPTGTPGVAQSVDTAAITKQVSDELSSIEKEKIYDSLPLRLENFSTSANLKTTINIYSLSFDPIASLRLEIYGPNYNDSLLTSPSAIAFKESFLEAKKRLVSKGVILSNLQIIYGNRQYIQDTATYWVGTFKLLD